MTPRLVRPVLLSLLALGAAACTGVESDPHRFENFAERVASIPVDEQPARQADEAGLRPASDLRVEVMDPHALWDARDGGLRGMVEDAGAKAVEAAAPAVARAAVDRAASAIQTGSKPAAPAAGVSIQLGAFSSEAAARDAWKRLQTGAAGPALSGLTPRYETVQVGGRTLTRLKVGPVPAHAAAVVCRTAEVSDPWCRRPA